MIHAVFTGANEVISAARAVRHAADITSLIIGIGLPVASQTERIVVRDEQFCINAAVGFMANLTAVPHRVVLEDKRPFVFLMAFKAFFAGSFQIGDGM